MHSLNHIANILYYNIVMIIFLKHKLSQRGISVNISGLNALYAIVTRKCVHVWFLFPPLVNTMHFL